MGKVLDSLFKQVDELTGKTEEWLEWGMDDYQEQLIRQKLDKLEYLILRLKTALINSNKKRPADNGDTYTVAEVASKLKVTRQTVTWYIEDGRLKSLSISGKGKRGIIRIRKSDFQLFLNQNELKQ